MCSIHRQENSGQPYHWEKLGWRTGLILSYVNYRLNCGLFLRTDGFQSDEKLNTSGGKDMISYYITGSLWWIIILFWYHCLHRAIPFSHFQHLLAIANCPTVTVFIELHSAVLCYVMAGCHTITLLIPLSLNAAIKDPKYSRPLASRAKTTKENPSRWAGIARAVCHGVFHIPMFCRRQGVRTLQAVSLSSPENTLISFFSAINH